MRIKGIKIQNFRGFEKKSFLFNSKLTVIVGNNTAGKTTLLQSIKIALGAYLKSLKSLPASDNAYKCNFTMDDQYLRFNRVTKDYVANADPTRVSVDAVFPRSVITNDKVEIKDAEISWYRELVGRTTSHSRECAGKLMDEVETMEKMRKSDEGTVSSIYPLVLSFGSNRIDNQYRSATKTKERESKVAKAYRSALKETVDFQSAFDWLYRYEQNRKKDFVTDGNMGAFINALTTAIPALSDVTVDTKNNELIALVSVRDQEPVYQPFQHMSDGFKSIICIVAEMAHRCIELNGFLGIDAVRRTPGVVLIDELDLYLHPRWQQHILKDLQAAFPLIQFIVSTHSPFIIQSVKSENLITLDGVKSDTDPIYRSIEEISLSEMNVETIRSRRYNEMLEYADRYFALVSRLKSTNSETEELRKKLEELEAEFSDNPAYVSLLKAEGGIR